MARAILVLTALIALAAAACAQERSEAAAWAGPSTEDLFYDESGGGVEVAGEMAFFEAEEVEAEFLAKAVEVGREAEFASEAVTVSEAPAGEIVETESAARMVPGGDDGGPGTAASVDRVIVRTVDASLVVSDVPAAVASIEDLAVSMDGWVVSASRGSENFGFVSFRVPAQLLDEAMARVRDLAVTVESENAQSRDVTDEYVDLTARLRNQVATEGALLELLDRAESVEDALEVRRELTAVREEIERLQGRVKLIEQTAAYSLVSVSLRRAPGDMAVDAGEDVAGAVDRPVRFRASFRPPEDVTDFLVTWDFGDGSEPVTTTRTAPTQEPGVRVTATVTHFYADDADSPYIAEVTIEGSGDGGLVEGSDVAIVSVFRLPRIEVFAGEPQRVEAGDEVSLSGSFTRPSELSGVEFTWDFGDGSDPVAGELQTGVTTAVAQHRYRDHRPFPYTATLTVRAQSKAGPVEASGSVLVKVDEAPGWTVGGWSAADTWRTIIRVLSGVGQVLVTILFWLGILSPVWLAAAGVVVWRRRRARR